MRFFILVIDANVINQNYKIQSITHIYDNSYQI
jgi:hypothetical protein